MQNYKKAELFHAFTVENQYNTTKLLIINR